MIIIYIYRQRYLEQQAPHIIVAASVVQVKLSLRNNQRLFHTNANIIHHRHLHDDVRIWVFVRTRPCAIDGVACVGASFL